MEEMERRRKEEEDRRRADDEKRRTDREQVRWVEGAALPPLLLDG